MTYPTLNDVSYAGRRVFLRADLNVPMKAGRVIDDTRIQRVLPSLKCILEKASQLIIVSHVGRPKVGEWTDKDSLKPVAECLSGLLGQDVVLLKTDFSEKLPDAPIVLVENVRFLKGETENDSALAKRMAESADVFVMDAFATAHRAHASCDAIAKYAKAYCIGPLFDEEYQAIQSVMNAPERPLLAVVGGAKVSTKLPLLRALLDKVDTLIVGGGIANTFLAASGVDVGHSLYEQDYIDLAKELLEKAKRCGVNFPLPDDVVVTDAIDQPQTARTVSCSAMDSNAIIVDVGVNTQKRYAEMIAKAKTIVWNGPLGIFEIPAYAEGTAALAKAIAQSDAYSLAGGGDTLAALAQFDQMSAMTYISTGGGAMLSVLQGDTLPILDTIHRRQGE